MSPAMNFTTNAQWPYYPYTTAPNNGAATPFTLTYSPTLTQKDFQRIEELVEKKLQEALHPETTRPSKEISLMIDGELYEGKLYLAQSEEDEGDEDEDDEGDD